jgi:4-amino-4-deoxy-L-arabinose transferase-like glycosyltransferase
MKWSTIGQSLLVFVLALGILVPTIGDFGLTWDEPAYRYSQIMSAQWWEQWAKVHTSRDVQELLDPQALLYYWPYGRYGINFHPPLAGQLNLATYAIFGHWLKDIPARRLATVIEFALCVTIGFHFLARRYGTWVGAIMAASLLLMPRLYGQAHLIDTDIAGLLLWAATALAFWNGLHESNGRKWRVLVGVLLGLAFVEKMAAVMVLGPLLLWLLAGHLPHSLRRPSAGANWADGLLTTSAMLIPLGLAFQQIQLLQRQLPPPKVANLFVNRPPSDWPGFILAIPLVVWCVRRLVAWLLPKHKIWGVERPALETWTSILAFAPVVGWLGNPAWWREALPRLAHYYTLSFDREGALPRIQIIYFGQVYEFSLPWHNAWVLIGITVPALNLLMGMIGILWGFLRLRHDRLPLYFFIHFMTLPGIRMFNTPAHDGVRLFLPTYFFLAAFAGWGVIWLADLCARISHSRVWIMRLAICAPVLISAAFELIRVHPYELSYYNKLIGGPRWAWKRGFELTYWYDAFNEPFLKEINDRLPPGAEVDFLNDMTHTAVPVFSDQQSLGILRGDIQLGRSSHSRFPFAWLLTQDSKSSAFTRLLFAMRPWLASEPRQLDGAQVAAVADPVAVSRAWALQLLLDAPDLAPPDPPAAPESVRNYAPWLARFWGDGLVKPHRLTVNQAILDWSRSDPEGLLAAARRIAAKETVEPGPGAERLMRLLAVEPGPKGPTLRSDLFDQLLEARPRALVEAVQIINRHRDEIVAVMTRFGYTDHRLIGGFLDRDLVDSAAVQPLRR